MRLEEDSTAVSLCGACLSAKKGMKILSHFLLLFRLLALSVLICVSLSALKKGLFAKTPHCAPMIPKTDTTKHRRLLREGLKMELYYSSNPNLFSTGAFSQSLPALWCLHTSWFFSVFCMVTTPHCPLQIQLVTIPVELDHHNYHLITPSA